MEQNQPNFGGYGSSGQMNPNGVGFGAANGGDGMNPNMVGFDMTNSEQYSVDGVGGFGGAGAGGFGGSTGAGDDVVFSSGGVKPAGGKKKFVIIGVILGVLVVVAVVLGILASGGGGGLFGGGELAGFLELKEFIEKGDEETRKLFEDVNSDEESESGESGEEYIMAIRISEKGETEVRKYYEKLEKLEQNFYNKSVTKVDSDKLSEYSNALKVLKNAINYYKTKEGLILAYEDGGDSGAETYFSDSISCNKDSGDLKDVCSLEEKYYTAVLTEHKVFAEAGCYKNGEYNLRCAKEYYGVVNFEIKKAKDGYSAEYMGSIEKKNGVISNAMLIIHNRLEGKNE